jgi:hypothetical protein
MSDDYLALFDEADKWRECDKVIQIANYMGYEPYSAHPARPVSLFEKLNEPTFTAASSAGTCHSIRVVRNHTAPLERRASLAYALLQSRVPIIQKYLS